METDEVISIVTDDWERERENPIQNERFCWNI